MKKNILRPLSIFDFGFRISDFGSIQTDIRHPKSDIKGPLSIMVILMLFCTSCKSLFPNDTTVVLQSQRLSAVKLTEKRVLVVSYDNELTREFAISLKNYVKEELKTHKIVAERINIRAEEESDVRDFEKLKTEFKPDYLLIITFKGARTRDFYMIGKTVKKLRGMTAEFNLKNTNDGQISWKSDAVVNHFYDNEGVATSKRIAKQLGLDMKKNGVID